MTLQNAKIINKKLYYDGSAAYGALNVAPRPIAQAILEAHDWFKENNFYK